MIAWALLTRMLGSGKIVKMIQISNPFWHFSGKFSAIILSERRRKNIAQLLNITSFSAPTFVLSVPFSVWVLFTPFPGMSVSFLKLSGIISAVSGDTGVSILSPPQLASDKHFLPRTSLSSNVPVLSSTRWSNQQPSNRQQPRTPFLWAFLMSQIFRQNSKFHVGLWPPRSVLLRETSWREKNSPQPPTIAPHLYSVSKIIKNGLQISNLKIMMTRGERHAPCTGGEGLMTARLMSWWRLIMADHISDPSLVWAGSGQLRPVWSYELRDTVSPQLPGNPFRCPTTCRVIYN